MFFAVLMSLHLLVSLGPDLKVNTSGSLESLKEGSDPGQSLD